MREAIDRDAQAPCPQEKFNEEHHIEPQTVRKAYHNDISGFLAEAQKPRGKAQKRKDGTFYTASGGAEEQGRSAEVSTAEAVAAEALQTPT